MWQKYGKLWVWYSEEWKHIIVVDLITVVVNVIAKYVVVDSIIEYVIVDSIVNASSDELSWD